MVKSYEASATIGASADDVWKVLTDVASYTQWDNGVDRVEGTVELGGKITVHPEGMKRVFPVKVTALEEPRRMTWTGGMPLGLFKGVRTFTLTPDGEGTSFTMREEFTGPMLPMIWRSMPDLQPSFDRFAAGLKARAEAGS